MHRITPTEIEQLTVKSTLYTLNTYPEAQILVCLLYDQPFLRYKVVNNRKCIE